MKNIISAVMMAFLLVACAKPAETELKVPSPEDVVMYQVNPRNYAPENSFNAVASHLDSIQTMGVNVLWFMPIYEIGELKSVNSPPDFITFLRHHIAHNDNQRVT